MMVQVNADDAAGREWVRLHNVACGREGRVDDELIPCGGDGAARATTYKRFGDLTPEELEDFVGGWAIKVGEMRSGFEHACGQYERYKKAEPGSALRLLGAENAGMP